MQVRAQNPAPWVPWVATAALAGVGVTGIVMGRRALATSDGASVGNGSDPDSGRILLGAKAVVAGGGAGNADAVDEQTMRTNPVGYTQFFTTSVEQSVLGQLQAWKNRNGTSQCYWVNKNVVEYGGIQSRPAYLKASELAAREVLDTFWPSGSPWGADEFWEYGSAAAAEADGKSLWRTWLWRRVMRLADEQVCGVAPVT